MLSKIECKKLIESPLKFSHGLNSVVGAENGHNSIGKSSVLMLIDFAFGGSDFPEKCDDVIRNVGALEIRFSFVFEKEHEFVRDTTHPEKVYRIEEKDYIGINEFNDFLKEKYSLGKEGLKFRECVSGFFRIHHKKNYDESRPLNVFSGEGWLAIRKRVLKLFGKYSIISDLEENREEEKRKSSDLKGAYNAGAVKKINKTIYKKNEKALLEFDNEVDEIKEALRLRVSDINKVLNEKSLELKKTKDALVGRKLDLDVKLQRINFSLAGKKSRDKKSFESVLEYFPEINEERLSQVEGFHNGISKILEAKLKKEKSIIVSALDLVSSDIAKIDEELLNIVSSKEDSLYLLENLMELDGKRQEIRKQNEFWLKDVLYKENEKKIKQQIEQALEFSVKQIESSINGSIEEYTRSIYKEDAVVPSITFGNTNYDFDHGDDRGTGKGFIDLLMLDLSFLEKTFLPAMIHDSLLFKNIDVPAMQGLVEVYSKFKKQIFISIDEVGKYSSDTQKTIMKSAFLELNSNKVAFGIKWNKNST